MGYIETAKEASKYTNKVGMFTFFISGIGISFNYYIPNLIPSQLIASMHWVLLVSCIGMIWFFIIHLKDPHYSIGETCPKCQHPILYTGIRCSNPNCDYIVKFL